MKTNNSTLPISNFSVKSTTLLRYFFTLTFVSFLITSSASFATGVESMRVNMYLLYDNNTTILADGVYVEYNEQYHDSVTLEDAYKFTNINENLGLTRYGCILAVERRPIITTSDTIFFKLWRTNCRKYQFEFVAGNLNHPGMQAFLEDAYLGTSTALSLNGTTKLNFFINTDTMSSKTNRFRIVYRGTNSAASVLPVTFAYLRGYQQNNKIAVDWKVENEINIEKYEVERSTNGTDFIKVNSTVVAGTNINSASYSWTDENPVSGNNFYRIKSVDRDGSKKFSLIIKVIAGKTGKGTITIYPNPIKGSTVNLQFSNEPAGIYQVRLINNSGQVCYSGQLSVNSDNISQTLLLSKKLSVGLYQLEVKAPDNTVNLQKAIVQD